MNDDEIRRIKLWGPVRSTDKAHLFRTTDEFDQSGREVWVPMSIIHHRSTLPLKPGHTLKPNIVDIEDWFCEREQL